MPNTTAHVLQSLLWPEPGISTERELYLRLSGPVAWSMTRRQLTFACGGGAGFDTASNLFNLGKWRRHCGLQDLHLRLNGAGRFELQVFWVAQDRSHERLYNEPIDLTPGQPLRIDLTETLPAAVATGELVQFSLHALGDGLLTDAAWETTMPPRQLPQLAVSITTFKREAAVRASVTRFEDFMAHSPLASHFHLIVVDNGQSAEIQASANVTPIANRNLGGSGGFARGLLAAKARGASHCLFMDDDASVHMGALERAWTFLAYASDPKTAVAGGIAMANHRWALWESGAVFDRQCHALWHGTDLRAFAEVATMELASTGPKPHTYYGGWWFFAFAIAEAKYRPFPFFVRGDDVSFSIANQFEIVTLPGIVCFQDADFTEKESPLTHYLDLRSHLAHHLALPSMDIGRWGTLGIVVKFFLRGLLQCHYDTLAARNLALKDVLRGPAFFAETADMAERRADLARLRTTEVWAPVTAPLPPTRRRIDPRDNLFWRWLLNLTFNGHLLPFFGYWGNQITLSSGQRGHLPDVWGAARITYVSTDGTQTFSVRHSKWAALRQAAKTVPGVLKLFLTYGKIRQTWQRGYQEIATDDFWREKLGLR